jgi:putative redox protein
MLFGALGSCFYSTFLSIAKKKRLSFDKAEVEVSGHKGTGKEINLLEKVIIKLVIWNPSNEKALKRSAELGSKFCSIHETISKVADIELIVEFQ